MNYFLREPCLNPTSVVVCGCGLFNLSYGYSFMLAKYRYHTHLRGPEHGDKWRCAGRRFRSGGLPSDVSLSRPVDLFFGLLGTNENYTSTSDLFEYWKAVMEKEIWFAIPLSVSLLRGQAQFCYLDGTSGHSVAWLVGGLVQSLRKLCPGGLQQFYECK